MALDDLMGSPDPWASQDGYSSVSPQLSEERLGRRNLARYNPPAYDPPPTRQRRKPADDFGMDDAVAGPEDLNFGAEDAARAQHAAAASAPEEPAQGCPAVVRPVRHRQRPGPARRLRHFRNAADKSAGNGSPLFDTEAEGMGVPQAIVPPGRAAPEASADSLEGGQFRTGGSALDDRARFETGMLSGEEAHAERKRRTRRDRHRSQGGARRGRSGEACLRRDGRPRAALRAAGGCRAAAHTARAHRRRSRWSRRRRTRKQAAGVRKAPLPTMGDARDIAERIPGMRHRAGGAHRARGHAHHDGALGNGRVPHGQGVRREGRGAPRQGRQAARRGGRHRQPVHRASAGSSRTRRRTRNSAPSWSTASSRPACSLPAAPLAAPSA